MECGRRNWPGPSPSVPHVVTKLPRFVELDDAPVAVAVGDVGVALRVPRDVGRPVERLRVVARLVLDAPRLQQLSVARELENLVSRIVQRPHVLIAIDAEAVRACEHPLAPRAQIFSLRVEDDELIRLRVALEHVDVALRVGRDRRHPPELHPFGHRFRLFAEANLDAVLHQRARVRRPAVGHIALFRRLASRDVRPGRALRKRRLRNHGDGQHQQSERSEFFHWSSVGIIYPITSLWACGIEWQANPLALSRYPMVFERARHAC